jgi:hypothetical protein
MESFSEMPGSIMGFGYDSGREVGDSGDELGEVSVMEVVSKVEMVVVGEESADSDEMLSRCWYDRQGPAAPPPVVPGCAGKWSSSLLSGGSTWSTPPPNTDEKDGNEAGKCDGLAWTGILKV